MQPLPDGRGSESVTEPRASGVTELRASNVPEPRASGVTEPRASGVTEPPAPGSGFMKVAQTTGCSRSDFSSARTIRSA